MTMHTGRIFGIFGTLCTLGALLLVSIPAHGELAKADKKAIRQAFDGTLYLRMDAPCATGRHSFGTYKRALVEVSPEGSNTEDTGTVMTASWWHADSTYWGIRINDPVQLDELDIEADDAEIEIELEGIDEADGNSTVVKLVGINSLADFERAFEQTFSRIPLQDTHDDWPAEIKDAIAERKLVNGMNRRQVFYITGAPESFEKKEDDGKEIETWHLRQNRGMKMGFFTAKMGEKTGLPATIQFVDGALVDAVQSGTSSDFSLDD